MSAPDTTLLHQWPSSLRRLLLALWGLFWLLMILVPVHDSWHNPNILWWQPLLWEGSSALVMTALALVMLRYSEHQRALLASPLRWFWRHIQWLPLISAAFVVLAYGIRHAVYALFGLHYEHEPWLAVWLYETMKCALYLGLWLGVLFGLHSFVVAREQQEWLHAMQRTLTEARLQQLKAQLQPHFLFNTLNTISALIPADPDRADALLNKLAELLRVYLAGEATATVPLREELRLLRLYADIMTTRFASRVQLQWNIDEAALAAPVPVLLLQPLLENAFRHGVEPSLAPTRIVISAERPNGVLALRVDNEPVHTAHEKTGNGIGLRNCRERLQAHYGDAATLTLANDGQCFSVTITIAEPHS
ncbi:MAG TPA: histidine kinase [Candidatus Acidoferrum sp.]|nr:histidine kinase [Candidatus Acidoferrum sp.]